MGLPTEAPKPYPARPPPSESGGEDGDWLNQRRVDQGGMEQTAPSGRDSPISTHKPLQKPSRAPRRRDQGRTDVGRKGSRTLKNPVQNGYAPGYAPGCAATCLFPAWWCRRDSTASMSPTPMPLSPRE
jgi:hypothetical protein